MKRNNLKKTRGGFTLIEILVVIGIIAVLAAIVIIAINPARQFAQARDTQRSSNLNAILNAVGQRIADNKGVFAGVNTANGLICSPFPTTGTTTIMTDPATSTTTPSGNLGCLVPTYIPALPLDPTSGIGTNTGYSIGVSTTTGRVTVEADTPESSIPRPDPITLTR